MAEGEIVFPNGKAWLDHEHRILRVVFRDGVDHDLKSAEEELAAVARIAAGKRHPVLVDISNIKSVSREARAYLAGSAGAVSCSAVALLSRSAVGNMLANVFLAVFGGQAPPTRLFSSEAEAIAWLKAFRA